MLTRHTAFFLLAIIAGLGCQKPSVDSAHTQVKTHLLSHARVNRGDPLNPSAMVWTLSASGSVLRDGSPSSVKEAGSLAWDVNRHLIEMLPGQDVKSCQKLLAALIGSHQTRIAFVGACPTGLVALTLPVLQDRRRLCFTVGDYVHQDSSEDEKHLFITARIQPGSQFLAEAIGHHSYGSLDAIYFPTDDADPTPAGKLTLPAWEGDHKLGIWMEADLKSFLDRTDVEKLSPIVVLKVKAADKVDDLLPCLSVLHAVAPRRFIVYIPQP